MIFYISLDVNEKKLNVDFSSNKTSFVKKKNKGLNFHATNGDLVCFDSQDFIVDLTDRRKILTAKDEDQQTV